MDVDKVLMKRKRVKASKRWTPELKSLLLQIIVQRKETFERPTAQVFYKKIIEHYPEYEEYGWEAMRDKVRNLKRIYVKAVEWSRTAGTDLLQTDGEQSFRDYILKLCPEFYSMDAIFCKKRDIELKVPMNSDDHLQYSTVSNESWPKLVVEVDPDYITPVSSPELQIQSPAVSPATSTPNPTPGCSSAQTQTPREEKKVRETKDSSHCSFQAQQMRSEYLKSKLTLMKEMHEQTIALKREKIDWDREMVNQDNKMRAMLVHGRLELEKWRAEKEIEEKLEMEKLRAEQEKWRAEQEKWRAEQEKWRAEQDKWRVEQEIKLKELELKYNILQEKK